MEKENKEKQNDNVTQVSLLGRKYQSVFITSFISERGDKPTNNSYVSYIELDNYGCWVVVDSNNDGCFKNKIAPFIGETIIESFIANPTIDRKQVKKILLSIHKKYRNMQLDELDLPEDYSSCSIAMIVTDYAVATFASVGNTRYSVLRNNQLIQKSKDDTLAYLQYEAKNILYDEIRFRKDKNIFTTKFGIDKDIKVNVSDLFFLKPNDRILLYTQGAWENLDEEDIELVSEKSDRPGKFIGSLVKTMKKNCFLSLGNYTFCGIYVNKPLEIQYTPIYENKFNKIVKKLTNNYRLLKHILISLAVILLMITGIKTYRKIEINKKIMLIEKEINQNIIQANINTKYEEYDKAIENYVTMKTLYLNLEKYKKVAQTKEQEIDRNINKLKILKDSDTLYTNGKEQLKENNFKEAIFKFENAKNQIQNIEIDNNLKLKIDDDLKIAQNLLEAENIKDTADKLYLSKDLLEKEKAVDLYKNIVLIYKKYERMTIYDSIMEKIKEYEEKTQIKPTISLKKKVKKTTKLPIYKGDKEFNEFRYYDSLDSYKKALKKADTPLKKQYLKGKIDMNNQLLIAVRLELKGDEYLENKKDYKKAKIYYEEALKENMKLANNDSMPKSRYKVIINRLEEKINKLK